MTKQEFIDELILYRSMKEIKEIDEDFRDENYESDNEKHLEELDAACIPNYELNY